VLRRGWKILGAVVALLVVLLAVNTVLTNADTESAEADGGRIVDLPGGDLHVREDGRANAPAAVLIHGWAASTHWFDRLTPLLAGRYRVIRVDLLGHGGSAKPKDGYSMEEQADRLAAALERLGVKRALVAGHSTGGEVAIALAARHPGLTRALAVIDTEPDEKYVDPDLLAKLSVTPVIGQAMRRLATDGTIKEGLGQAFAEGYEVPDVFVDDFNKLTYTAYTKTYDESADYVDEGHLADDIRSVRVPRLVMFGKEDRLVEPPLEAAKYFRDEFGVRTEIVPGAGHSPMVEQPHAVYALLTALDPPRSVVHRQVVTGSGGKR
jgi:pimeloyl-ACP methyl ester carboxylesterase